MQDSGTIFFADDAMILMQTLQEAIQSIQILSEIANDCGLSINKNKSNIIIFNCKNQPEYIEDIHFTTKFTYHGVKIKKDCYKLQRIEASKKAKKYASMMPAVIAKSCNKILIGKLIGNVQHYHQYYMERKLFILAITI